jgi:D-glycero-D-manno-heptose 1,7-bisphosphate phosphatase
MQMRALLLDRDGVININHGYVHHTVHFEFIEGIFELARAAYALEYMIVVITNQAGIARGYYSERQFAELSEWMCAEFAKQGAVISKVYYSPYHPTEGLGKYRRDDISRKPGPGMILQARQEFSLDLRNSVLIGDKESDIEAGIAAGVGCNILFDEADSVVMPRKSCHRVTVLRDAIPLLTTNKLQDLIT